MDLPFDASGPALALVCLGALCLDVSKTGFSGLAIINVLLLAELFGAKNSVGIILPLLIICDLAVFIGRHLVHLIPQRAFEILLYGFSALAAIRPLVF